MSKPLAMMSKCGRIRWYFEFEVHRLLEGIKVVAIIGDSSYRFCLVDKVRLVMFMIMLDVVICLQGIGRSIAKEWSN